MTGTLAGTGGDVDNASVALLGRDRTPFLPARVWAEQRGAWRLVDRARDSKTWARAARADVPLITQWDNGDHEGDEPGTVATCSSSQPSVTRQMLDALDVQLGQHVLDVGTGTGYTAALLEDRVGTSGTVVSVEVDDGLAAAARTTLDTVGARARVLAADGAASLAGPFDRTLVTFGVRTVPPTWIEQTVTGGRVVMPWGTDWCRSDRLLTLLVGADAAAGRLGPGLDFMKMRAEEAAWKRAVGPDGWLDRAERWEADAEGTDVAAGLDGWGEYVLGLLMPPGVVKLVTAPAPAPAAEPEAGANGDRTAYFYADGSAAALTFGRGSGVHAAEFGPRSLAADYLAALRWWLDHGCPDAQGFGVGIDAAGQRVWFGSPRGPAAPG
ncbi:methyltransferase domain-containing protein [Streptodolium elevatio]|uniref:Protein-L-isoaspartate O-methyltransferase n=1 Tax=Streptodolium elevatio TaxID=3157996 RepID=A0ABV3DA71_9ACTN